MKVLPTLVPPSIWSLIVRLLDSQFCLRNTLPVRIFLTLQNSLRFFLAEFLRFGYINFFSSFFVGHIRDVMTELAPSRYQPGEHNINTPFTVRYQYCALFKYNKSIVEMSTKPAQEGGNFSSRTFMPKSFRKKTGRDEIDAVLEKAEIARQNHHRTLMREEEAQEKSKERDASYEAVWRRLAESDTKQSSKTPLTEGLNSIVTEMSHNQQRPSLFFNLACFLPNISTDRIDMMQPICGYALIGRIVAVMGPPETDLATFLRALTGIEPQTAREAGQEQQEEAPPPQPSPADVLHRNLTVFDLLKIAESTRPDRGSQPVHESAQSLLNNLGLIDVADTRIGTLIQRGLSATEMNLAAAGNVSLLEMNFYI
jgi:hypothetical protein